MQENDTSDEIEKKLDGGESGDSYGDVRYEFSFGEEVYLNEHEILVEPNLIKLHQIIGMIGTPKLTFVYDYGDNWKVKLMLESYEKKEVSLKELPYVIEGEGYGIVEDVGGTYGLERLYEILKNPKDPEYESYTRWLDSTTLDLTEFDREGINFRIKKLLRIYRDIYEYEILPTKKSEDLWMRRYKNKGTRGY